MDVQYDVQEGERAFFGRTVIRGNAFTRIQRIRRQIAWKEGEPFSAEKIADTQQNLARTGVFRSIDVRPQPTNPESQTRNIDVELTEENDIAFKLIYPRPPAGRMHVHAAMLKKLGPGYGGLFDASEPDGRHLGWEQLSYENPNYEITLPPQARK